jgi:hypothetical protein
MGIEPKNLTLSLADSTPLGPLYPLKSTVIGAGFGLHLDYAFLSSHHWNQLVWACGAGTANGCLVLHRVGTHRREARGRAEEPEDGFPSVPQRLWMIIPLDRSL